MENDSYKNTETKNQVFSFSVINTLIGLSAASLLGYGVAMFSASDMELFAGCCAGLMAAVFLGMIGNCGSTRSSIVIQYVSWTFLIVALIVTLVLGNFCQNYSKYIVSDGLILVVYLAIVAFVAKSGQ